MRELSWEEALTLLDLIVDSDGGIDDAVAITWLCQQPDVRIRMLTAVGGSVPARRAATNLRLVVEAAGKPELPVYVGLDQTNPAPATRKPVRIHGHDGLGDVGYAEPDRPPNDDEDAPTVLARELHRGTSLLTLGPMTNVAAVIGSGGSTGRSVLTFMGGSARAGGNARPTAEANIAHDPTSAAVVLESEWDGPPLMIGLDVTHKATLTASDLDLLNRKLTTASEFLSAPIGTYRRFAGAFCSPGEMPCHDLLAAMAAVDPSIVTSPVLPVAVDTGGSAAWGETVVDLRYSTQHGRSRALDGNAAGAGKNIAVALQVDVAAFRRRIRRIFGEDLMLAAPTTSTRDSRRRDG